MYNLQKEASKGMQLILHSVFSHLLSALSFSLLYMHAEGPGLLLYLLMNIFTMLSSYRDSKKINFWK